MPKTAGVKKTMCRESPGAVILFLKDLSGAFFWGILFRYPGAGDPVVF
jgi:hypothetical protein